MKHLKQKLCTKTDSFSYTVLGEDSPTYHVDSSGYLSQKGKEIGKFCLDDEHQWKLRINGEFVDLGFEGVLFHLPEFELRALTALINKSD